MNTDLPTYPPSYCARVVRSDRFGLSNISAPIHARVPRPILLLITNY